MLYKCVKQYDSTDCASACLASITWYYGKRIPLENIINNSNMNKEGMNLLEVVKVAKKIGLNAVAMKRTEDFDEIQLSLPCISHVILENGMLHFVVIYKILKNKVIIADPTMGILKVNRNDFFNSIYTSHSQYIWSGVLIFLTPNDDFFIKENNQKKQNTFLTLLTSEKRNIIKIIFLSVLSMCLKVIDTFYFQIILDKIIPNQWFYTLVFVTLVFIVMALTGILMDKISVKESLNVSRKINQKLSMEYYKHVLKLSANFHDLRKSGEIISRFQDADKVQRILITSVLILPVDTLFICVVSVLLIQKSLRIFCIVLFMCIAYFLIVILFRKKYEMYNTIQMMEEAKVTTQLVDSLEGIETIKSYGLEKSTFFSVNKIFKKWQDAILTLGNTENNQAAIKTIINRIGELIIISVGTLEVMKGTMTIGELITYNVLIGYLLTPIKNVIDLQPQFHTAAVAMGRLESILNINEEDDNGAEIVRIENIELEHVYFGYDLYSKSVSDVSLMIKQYRKTAIIGNSGSGKTTIAKLLMKFYIPQEGQICINRKTITSINTKSIRESIVYVSQEDFIFSSTIKDNLTLGDDSVPFEEIVNISKITGVHDFVINLQQQYNTVLEERGANLSKGQRQKIALARALLRKPQVLVLDEATSNIDTVSERKIYDELNHLSELTLVVITHRLSNIIDSDKIYVLDKGIIVAQGNHQTLIKNSKLYKEYFKYNLFNERIGI